MAKMVEGDMTREERIEAVAEAWASIDGKLYDFRAGKTAPNIEDFEGHYAGYMSDAQELISRIGKRGYVLLPREPTEEMVRAGAVQCEPEGRWDGAGKSGAWGCYVEMLLAYEQSKPES